MKNDYQEGNYPQPTQYYPQVDSDEEGINIKKWLVKIISNWYLFLLGVFAALTIAFFVNKRIVPSYKVGTTVLIEEFKRSNLVGAQSVMQGYGLAGYTNVNNQVVILQTFSLIEKSLKVLDLSVDYYARDAFREMPLYKNSPITVIFDTVPATATNLSYEFRDIDGSKYKIISDGNDFIEGFTLEGQYGLPIEKEGVRFTIVRNESFFKAANTGILKFNYRDKQSLVREFNGRMTLDYVMTNRSGLFRCTDPGVSGR